MYARNKMILLCSGEDSIYSGTSTGSDVLMTSNCMYHIFVFSSTLLKTQMVLSEQIISFRAFSVLHFKVGWLVVLGLTAL